MATQLTLPMRPTSPYDFCYTGDVNVEHGGMFMNLDDWFDGYVDVLRITDLDSAAGAQGMVILEKLTTYPGQSKEPFKLDRGRIKEAFEACGWYKRAQRRHRIPDRYKWMFDDGSAVSTPSGDYFLKYRCNPDWYAEMDEKYGYDIPEEWDIPSFSGDNPAWQSYAMLITEALVSYGWYDVYDGDYHEPSIVIVQTDPDEDAPMEIDGWKAEEQLEEGQDLFDWLLDNDWLRRF